MTRTHDDEAEQLRVVRNLDASSSSLTPEERLVLATVEKRLMAKYERIIAEAERAEALLMREQGAPRPAWIVRTLRVPAYWDGNCTVPVRREELQDAVRDLVAHEGIEPNAYEVNSILSASEGWTVRVQAADAATADLMVRSLHEWLDYQVDKHNYRLTEERGEIVEVQLADAAPPVGASLVQLHRHGNAEGVFIDIKKPETALAHAVGGVERTKHCAILKSVGGRACTTIPIFKGVKRYAQDRGEPLRLELRCLLPEDAWRLWRKQKIVKDEEDDEDVVPMEVDENQTTNNAAAKIKRAVTVAAASRRDPTQRSESPASSLTDTSSQVSDPSSIQKKNQGYSHDGYNHFYTKYGDLVVEEFKKGANIHKNSAMGYMWTQHKKLFGEMCSNDCQCARNLPELTASVVTDQLEKKSSWDNPRNLRRGDYPVGITGNFARTFVPRLTRQRPDENSIKLLERLLAMWEIHRRNRIFGIRCQEGCECSEGWELVFRKGVLRGETLPGIESSKGSSAKGQVGLGPIPKKRKSPKNAAAAAPVPKKTKILPPSAPGPLVVAAASRISSRPALKLKTLIQGNAWTAVSTSTGVPAQPQDGVDSGHSFDIEFDCDKALGFYSVTEKKTGNYCKIMYVIPEALALVVVLAWLTIVCPLLTFPFSFFLLQFCLPVSSFH